MYIALLFMPYLLVSLEYGQKLPIEKQLSIQPFEIQVAVSNKAIAHDLTGSCLTNKLCVLHEVPVDSKIMNATGEILTDSADGSRAILLYGDYVYCLNLFTGEIERKILRKNKLIASVSDICRATYNENPEVITIRMYDGKILNLDLNTGKECLISSDNRPVPIANFANRPDKKQYAQFSEDNKFIIEVMSYYGEIEKDFRLEHSSPVREFSYTQDGINLISICDDGKMHLWNTASGIEEFEFNVSKKPITSLLLGKISNLGTSCDGDSFSVFGLSGSILEEYFQESKCSELYLFWLVKNYQKYLKENYPGRSAMRIQDIVEYAHHAGFNQNPTHESLSQIAKKLPINVRRALVRHFGIYDATDKVIDEKLKQIRRIKRRRIE